MKADYQTIINNLDYYYKFNILNKTEQQFAEFLSMHPNLYNGVDLTSAEIDFINNYFWSYNIEPQTFETDFINCIRKNIVKYHKLKFIELDNELFSFISDKSTRHQVAHMLSNKTSEATRNTTTSQESETDFKNANRDLPMKSTGQDFDGTINWQNGASNIEQNKNNYLNNIKNEDLQNLNDNLNNFNDITETNERRVQLPVEIIEKITNYLIKPKSIDFLIEKLKPAFILVY